MTANRAAALLAGLWAGILLAIGLIGAPAGFATLAASADAGRVAGRPAYASPPPPPMATKAVPSHGLRVGQSVFHTKFGEGVVLTLEGAGPDARAQVNFGWHGAKWLALAIAKLTPVD